MNDKAKPDVLAVMDVAATFARAYHLNNSAEDYVAARDAVSELVASAREAAKQLRLAGDAAHAAHLEGALARVGGAK